MADVVIRGALAALPGGIETVDIGIDGERFGEIAEAGSLQGPQTIEAAGLVALPGGVDPHVHIDTQFGDWRTTDDFGTATVPAALGGTTSIIEFAIPRAGESAADAVERCLHEARVAAVDYTLHACVTGERFEESLHELTGLAAAGIRSVKVFSTYMDSVGLTLPNIGQVLQRAADADLTVLVHAEDNDVISAGIARQVAAGSLGPRGHADSRSADAEASAVDSVAQMARDAGAHVFFVHISSADGAEAVRRARRAGGRVNAETCIQYLLLDDSVYDRDDGELWICAPPIRSAGHQHALWDAVADGTFDLISTDHNCFTSSQKFARRADFRQIPNGLPGIQLRLPALFGEVASGRLDWSSLARVVSEGPARVFGLWPRKGCIATGSDADLVLVDPAGTTDLAVSEMATDYSPFAGRTGAGAIVQTWLRGRQVVVEGAFIGERGEGNSLATA